MILGKVVGHVWATRKDPRLEQHKLLLVRPYGIYDADHATEQLIAVDALDAGVGDDVLLCCGSPARWSLGGQTLPVDMAVAAVVDRVDFETNVSSPRISEAGLRARPLAFIGGKAPQEVDRR
ncbi:MAG: EutN/CcmL family microcompartment protein [Deltaproteobacteria bacterium]|nr:EutN/CcmL family microcompartment protein [Deltaproteobacteria bacterium]